MDGALPANLLIFGGPLAVFVFLYVNHGRRMADRILHLPEFMFDPSREGVIAFSIRTIRAEIELFSPGSMFALGVLAAAALGAFSILADRRRHRRGEHQPVAMLFPLMLVTMGVLTLTAAIAGHTPSGGRCGTSSSCSRSQS
jgi:hypothetical protein